MNLDQFFEKFELLSETPNAVGKMRELILELAVMGKLSTRQDADEPASISFPKFASTPTTPNHSIYPEHWTTVPLKEIGLWSGGGTPSKSHSEYWEGNIPWVSPKDMKQLRISDSKDHISPAALDASSVKMIKPGSILFVVRGMILAHSFPVALTEKEVTINQDMKAISPFYPEMKEYILFILQACKKKILSLVDRSTHGTCKLSTDALEQFYIGIPPLAEQKRIVAKVDELMALCDRLEAQQEERETQNAALVQASLTRFTDAPTPTNLEFLFHKSYAVEPEIVRNLIITLAVRGRLATAGLGDKPASDFVIELQLRRKIEFEADVKIAASTGTKNPRKPRNDFVAYVSDEAENLPTGWCETRIADIADCLDYMRVPVNKMERGVSEGTVPYYGANGQVGLIDKYIFDEELVLVVEDETFIGRTKPFSYVVKGKTWVNNHAHVLRPLGGISADYLNICLCRYPFIPLTSGTTGRRKLTQASLMDAKLWLAPLPEQKRIVAKVEELMALVDKLEAQLATSREAGAKLLEAVVAEIAAAA